MLQSFLPVLIILATAKTIQRKTEGIKEPTFGCLIDLYLQFSWVLPRAKSLTACICTGQSGERSEAASLLGAGAVGALRLPVAAGERVSSPAQISRSHWHRSLEVRVPARAEEAVAEALRQWPGCSTLASGLCFSLGWPLSLLLSWQGFGRQWESYSFMHANYEMETGTNLRTVGSFPSNCKQTAWSHEKSLKRIFILIFHSCQYSAWDLALKKDNSEAV